jgi:stage V sporulation protein R
MRRELPDELQKAHSEIKELARHYGLNCFDIIFELVDYNEINEIAALGGFPTRYPHWRFGMDYDYLNKSYTYGLQKIYELVINTDPCYAYLQMGNEIVDQKLVMAHVYGHCDFFKNNVWFSKSNRKMMDQMANHGTRIRRYIDRYGVDVVESFIDKCLSIENLIDRHSVYSPNTPIRSEEEKPLDKSYLLKYDREYMRDYINPPEFVAEQKRKIQEKAAQQQRFPEKPERDILKFLIHYGPLTEWQQDVLSIIRDEAYYYAPQGMTKTMNEGWASYWHTKLMTQKILNDSEVIDYADHHSGTVAMSPEGYNPYKVGIELFREIEDRWNKGQFGREWEACDDVKERKNWNKKTNLGRQKIFEIRKFYNDVTFIDEFLTEDFCVRNKMFVYKFNKRTNQFEIDTTDFKAIKAKLLFHMTNFGQPIVRIQDANFENRGELLISHLWEGVDMQPDFMSATLKNLYALWARPVNLMTVMDNENTLFRFDGNEWSQHKIGGDPKPETPKDEDKKP